MARKKSLKPDKEPKQSADLGGSGKISGLSSKAFGIIKFSLGICLLPFVYSASAAFVSELGLIDISYQRYLWAGAISFLLIYLFIWEMSLVYDAGHKVLEIMFSFFAPLVKVAPYLLSIYTVVLFIVYGLLSMAIKEDWLLHNTVFLAGFTVALHLVFSAKLIRTKKDDFLKANYLFGFSFIYLLNVSVIAFFLSLTLKEFSFVNFCSSSYIIGSGIFSAVFRQIFVR